MYIIRDAFIAKASLFHFEEKLAEVTSPLTEGDIGQGFTDEAVAEFGNLLNHFRLR